MVKFYVYYHFEVNVLRWCPFIQHPLSKFTLRRRYHLPSQSDDYYFSHVSNFLDAFSSIYDRFLLVGNFNAGDSEKTWFNFLEKHNSANIAKE